MNYYNNVKHLITQTHIDINHEIESTVKFDGLNLIHKFMQFVDWRYTFAH